MRLKTLFDAFFMLKSIRRNEKVRIFASQFGNERLAELQDAVTASLT